MDSVFRVSLVLDMIDNMTGKVTGAAGGVSSALSKLDNTFGVMQKAGTVMAGAGTAITGSCVSIVSSTFDTQDALAELSSLGVEDLASIEKAAKNFSDTWAGTTKADFISASYDIKSGIASLTDEGVAQFTELSALTAKATKSTAGEMTSLFATGYGIYKGYYNDLSDLEFGEMFSAGIATAVKNYKTSGSGMADAIKTIGATATNANVPMEEQLAILGQLQATMSGSEAGTKYKAFLNAAAGAGDKLGLSFLDANNNLLSMPDILETLRGKYGDTIDALEKKELKEAFGTDEAIALIDLLYNNTDQLKTGIDDLQTSMAGGTQTTEQMAKAINDTPAGKFEVLKQELHNATEELGQGLLPMANAALGSITNLVKQGSDWVTNNQETVGTIMRIVAMLGIFLIVVGAGIAIIGTVGKTLTGLRTALNLARTATGGLSGALLSSPFAWVMLAVVALIGIFRACGGDIEQLGGIFDKIFSAVVPLISGVLSGIAEHLPEFLQFGISLISSIVQGIAERLPDMLVTGIAILQQILMGLLQMLPNITTVGLSLLDLLTNAVVSGLPALLTAGISLVQMLVAGLAQMLPQILDAGIAMLTQLLTGILQNLTRLFQTGMTLVSMLVTGAATLLPQLAQMGIQLMLQLLTGILQNLPSLLQTGITLIGMFIQGTASNLPSLLQTGISLILMVLQGILSAIPQLLTAAIQLVPMLVQGIASNAPTLISSGISLIGQLLTGIVTAIPAVLGMIPDMFGQIGSAIMEIDWLGLGGDLVSGIADGFVSGFNSLVDSVKGLWDGFVGWFKGDDSTETVSEQVIYSEPARPPAPATPQTVTTTQTVDVLTNMQVTDPANMQQQGEDAINALIAGVETATPGAQAAASQSAMDIMSQFGMDGTDPSGIASSMMADLTAGIEAGTPAAQASAESAANDIMSSFNLDGSGAATAADDIMSNLINGITNGTPDASAAAAAAGQTIMDSLSTDATGAATAATDMLNNVASTIDANAASAQSAAASAGQNILAGLTAGTATAAEDGARVMTDVTSGITGESPNTATATQTAATAAMNAWKAATASASSLGTSFMNLVTNGIRSAGSSAVSAAQSIANQIRTAFQNMSITVPAPKLPHVSVNYSTVGSGNATATVPDFSVSYYAEGAILTRPTLFGMNGSTGMVGGEAGDEAILPLATLWSRMREIVSETIFGKKSKGDTNSISGTARTVRERSEKKETKTDSGKKIIVQKLEMNVDISSMDDMNKLSKLIEQIEGNNDPAYV